MLDYNATVLLYVQNIFSRPVVITPYTSQPGKPAYTKRGVYVTIPMDVVTEANVVFSDQRTGCDIRVSEYPIPPDRGDWLFFPAHMSMPAAGPFEIRDADLYHDGRVRLSLVDAHVDEPRNPT